MATGDDRVVETPTRFVDVVEQETARCTGCSCLGAFAIRAGDRQKWTTFLCIDCFKLAARKLRLDYPTPDTASEERAVLTELLRKLDEAPEPVRAFYGASTIALMDRAREVLARRTGGKDK